MCCPILPVLDLPELWRVLFLDVGLNRHFQLCRQLFVLDRVLLCLIRFWDRFIDTYKHLPKFSCLFYENWWRYGHRRKAFGFFYTPINLGHLKSSFQCVRKLFTILNSLHIGNIYYFCLILYAYPCMYNVYILFQVDSKFVYFCVNRLSQVNMRVTTSCSVANPVQHPVRSGLFWSPRSFIHKKTPVFLIFPLYKTV